MSRHIYDCPLVMPRVALIEVWLLGDRLVRIFHNILVLLVSGIDVCIVA
jgi:hypothetical protein